MSSRDSLIQQGIEVARDLESVSELSEGYRSIYLAGSIHDSDDNGKGWRTALQDAYRHAIRAGDALQDTYGPGTEAGVDLMSPTDAGPDVQDTDTVDDETITDIVESDLSLIARSDAVLVRYDGERTFGTMMEMALARERFDVPVVVAWTADFAVAPWVRYVATRVTNSVPLALAYLVDGLQDDQVLDRLTNEYTRLYSDSSDSDHDASEEVVEEVLEGEVTAEQLQQQFAGMVDPDANIELDDNGEDDEDGDDEEDTSATTAEKTGTSAEEAEALQEMANTFDGDTHYQVVQSEDGDGYDTELFNVEQTPVTERDGDTVTRQLLERVGGLVDDDRETHGDAVENQEHIAQGWNWYLNAKHDVDLELDGADVARMMELLKLSRLSVGEYDLDHDVDVAGYAGIAAAVEATRNDAGDDAEEFLAD